MGSLEKRSTKRRSWRLPLAALALAALSPALALGIPDPSKRVPLSFTGIDIFHDSTLEDVYYILPSELVVDSNRFSSRSAYAWRTLSDGTASVQMVARMYSSDDLILQATREINKDTGQQVRYRGLEIRNPRVKVFEDPALVAGVDVTLSTNADPLSTEGSSFSKAALRFRLTKDGAALWKDAIRSGVFVVSGSLAFEFKATSAAGVESFVAVEIPLTVRSLPDPDQPLDTTRALKSLAMLRGEQYFFGQYASCRMFFESALFRAPASSELESDDPLQSDEERALYVKTAKDVFNVAVERQRGLCVNEVERLRGEDWMNTTLSDRGFTDCRDALTLPPWSQFFFGIQTSTMSYIAGAKKRYDRYKADCGTPLKVTDFRVNMVGDCVRNIAVAFSESPDMATLSGNIIVYSTDFSTNRFSSIAVEKLESNVLVFHFETPLCRDTRNYVVELTDSLRGVSGRRLYPVYPYPLDFAPHNVLRILMQPSGTAARLCVAPGAVKNEPPSQKCSVKAACVARQGGLEFTRQFLISSSITRSAVGESGACIEIGEWLSTLPSAARFERCEAEVQCRD